MAQTAAAEVASYAVLEGKTLVSNNVVVNNVLDSTGSAARQALRVTLDQIIQSNHGGAAYDATEVIGKWAREPGYQAILAPSAQDRSDVNLISFKSLGKIDMEEIPKG